MPDYEPDPVALTLNRGVLHKYPAYESDNLDDGEYHIFLAGVEEARRSSHYRRDCKRCFKSRAAVP